MIRIILDILDQPLFVDATILVGPNARFAIEAFEGSAGAAIRSPVAEHFDESVYSADTLLGIHDADYAELLLWARERFGIGE